ncbi:MAG: glycosyltransferase family 2 protein [Methanofollis liminatans]|jgi:glycosyltransferase involved in cell wall biosynthesis|nr:glycosyltransferase family 2 protein [Methanofollis liminatans]
MPQYILVTPAKDEGANLPSVIASVAAQTIQPEVWLILDDGSTDATPRILQEAVSIYPWIRILRLPPHPRDITFHYSYVCKMGFDEIIRFCTANNIHYQYIGLLDGDTEVSDWYFETLIRTMEENASLGIVSGRIHHRIDGVLTWNKSNEHRPAGTGRLWRKECFFESGGYPIEPSPDSISNIKAKRRGWKIRKCKEAVAVERRMTSGADGLWHGYKMRGKTAYYLNKRPLSILMNSAYFTIRTPHYTGAAYLYGYLHDLAQKKKQIEDEEIKNYYRKERLPWFRPE